MWRRGSARCASACATSTGPQEFLESLRDADIIRKPASLVYVQALKFLQTKATPTGARRAAKERRIRRAERRAAPQVLMHPQEQPPHGVETRLRCAGHRRRDPREVPRARDPRAQHAHPRAPGLRALPARQPDAGARLRAPAGRRLPAQVRAAPGGGRGGRGVLRPRRHRADEVVQAPGHRPAGGVRDAVRRSARSPTPRWPTRPASRAWSRSWRSCSRRSSW